MSEAIAIKATCEIKSVGARERAARLIESKRETLTPNPHSLSTALLSSSSPLFLSHFALFSFLV